MQTVGGAYEQARPVCIAWFSGGGDAIAAVEPSGHGTDEDAADDLQR